MTEQADMESKFLSELLGLDRRGLNLHCVYLRDGGNLSLIELPWECGCWEAWVQMLALPDLGLDSAKESCLDKQPASSSQGKPDCRGGSEVCC